MFSPHLRCGRATRARSSSTLHVRLTSSVSLQRTYRMPKEVRVEPQKFAAELIHRLEAVQRTREAEEKLEERLKRVRMVSGSHGGAPRRVTEVCDHTQ